MDRVLVFVMAFALVACATPGASGAAGPWKAQVVDAETGQPLEGVVVLFVWLEMTRTFGGPSPEYHDAEEVLTRNDGLFSLAPRRAITLNPLTYIREPVITIFKPGYGNWRVREWEKKPKEWEELSAAEVLEKDGIVLELLRLKTYQERLQFYTRFTWNPMAPPEKTRHIEEAVRVERAYLGFRN